MPIVGSITTERNKMWLEKNKLRYEIQLRNVWWNLVETYPDLYTGEMYRQACEELGIPVF